MKKALSLITLILCLSAIVLGAVGCEQPNKNSRDFWFEKYSTNFVGYDETANDNTGNLDVAGSYWELTVKDNCSMTISIEFSNLTVFDGVAFYVNGSAVEKDGEMSSLYNFVFSGLRLKAGDVIKIHAHWLDPDMAHRGFKISKFSINDGTGSYNIHTIK